MDKALRIQKSEVARKKRHLTREFIEKKKLNEYRRLRKLRKRK